MSLKWALLLALLVLPGCADMKVAKVKIKDEAIQRPAGVRSIAYAIDTEYLEEKFVTFFEVSHNEEALSKARHEFVDQVRTKIKNSMPSDAPYLSDSKQGSIAGRYIVFLPVIRSMPDEKDGFVIASCDITVRVYEGNNRTRSLKASERVSLKYGGHYSFIGTVEYYKNFMWEDSLIAKLEEAQNQVLEASLKRILEKLSTL